MLDPGSPDREWYHVSVCRICDIGSLHCRTQGVRLRREPARRQTCQGSRRARKGMPGICAVHFRRGCRGPVEGCRGLVEGAPAISPPV